MKKKITPEYIQKRLIDIPTSSSRVPFFYTGTKNGFTTIGPSLISAKGLPTSNRLRVGEEDDSIIPKAAGGGGEEEDANDMNPNPVSKIELSCPDMAFDFGGEAAGE